MRLISSLVLLGLLTAASADAQWLNLPTPGLPRLPDGKPNLSAPTPRAADGRPDLSGLWRNNGGDRLYNNIAVDLLPGDVAPWADAIYQKRKLEFGKDSMETRCLPLGPQYLTTKYRQMRVVQTPSLVVESNGYTDRSWLDWDGHPHTEALRITERYTRRDVGRIDVIVTMTDPKAYPRGISFTMPMLLQADTELIEFVCENNARSLERIAATPPAVVVQVPVATLSGYVGVYDLVDESSNGKTVAAVTLQGSVLSIDYDAKGREALVPLAPTRFSWSGTVVEFVVAADGGATMVIHYAESDERGPRRR